MTFHAEHDVDRSDRLLADIAQNFADPSDPATKPHGIWDTYQPYLAPLREAPVRVLELGVARGTSAKTFATYFRNGRIVALDMSVEGIDITGLPHLSLHACDQPCASSRSSAPRRRLADSTSSSMMRAMSALTWPAIGRCSLRCAPAAFTSSRIGAPATGTNSSGVTAPDTVRLSRSTNGTIISARSGAMISAWSASSRRSPTTCATRPCRSPR